MFKKTLLTLAIICFVFNQTSACKKKMKGAFNKIKPKRYQKLSPSPSIASSASDISFIQKFEFEGRSRQGKKTPSILHLDKLFKNVMESEVALKNKP